VFLSHAPHNPENCVKRYKRSTECEWPLWGKLRGQLDRLLLAERSHFDMTAFERFD